VIFFFFGAVTNQANTIFNPPTNGLKLTFSTQHKNMIWT